MIKIRLVKPFSKEFLDKWPSARQFYVGWVTWISTGQARRVGREGVTIHPENNKYTTNFPADHFEI